MDSHVELALWTAGSVLLSVLGAHLAWIAAQQPRSWLGRFRAGWAGNPLGRVFLFLVRLTFYLGIPYAALMRSALSPVIVGLQGTQTADLPWWTMGWSLADWARALGWMFRLGGIAALTLVWGWWNVRRAMGAEFPPGGAWTASSILIAAHEGIYAEIHWAFYRAAPLLFIADPYWATLTGAALVMVEWSLNPAWRTSLSDGPQRAATLMQMGWLALSTTLFVMTYNVWPIILLRVTLAWAIGRWVALLATGAKELPSS